MALADRQLARLTNEVIQDFLQEGAVPSVGAVLAGVYQRLNGSVPGTPQSTFHAVAPNALTQPLEQSTQAERIYEDVLDLLGDNIALANRIVRDFDHKQTYRERLKQRIIELQSQLNQTFFTETFSQLGHVDLEHTDAYVDFRSFALTLPPATNLTTRVDLTAAALSYQAGTTTAPVGALSNIVNEQLNASFFVRANATTTATNMSILLALPQAARASRLTVATQCGSSVQVTAQLDDVDLPVQSSGPEQYVEWVFAPRDTTSVRLTLTKNTPDDQVGSTYLFDFGIRNVSLFLEHYQPQALLTSTPIEFPSPVQAVTFTATQDVPANCAVDWALSFDAGTSFLSAQSGQRFTFSTPRLVDSKRVYGARTVRDNARVFSVVNDLTSQPVDAGLAVSAAVRGNRAPLFALCHLDPTITFGQTTVWRGRNAWKVSAYHYDITDGPTIQDPAPTIDDWYTPRGSDPVIYTRYQPTEFSLDQLNGLDNDAASAIRLPAIEYPFAGANDRVMHLFEATVLVDRTLAPSVLSQLNTFTVDLPPLFGSGKAALYLNGQRLTIASAAVGSSQQFSAILPLRPGPNSLQIVTNAYASLGGLPFTIGTTALTTWCADAGALTWYADPGPMTEVSLFELQFQTARNDFSRYARSTAQDIPAQVILVRELPTTRYEVRSFSAVDSSNPTSCIVQATLQGSPLEPALTPRIQQYHLTT